MCATYERVGDAARRHHVYELAAQHYKDALQLSNADTLVSIHLLEKLAETLWLGKRPGAVSKVNDRILALCRLHPEHSAEHIRTLFRVYRQLWVDSRTRDIIAVLNEAIRIAELSTDLNLLQRTNVAMANVFAQLARFEDADRYLRVVEQLHQLHGIVLSTGYYVQRGFVSAGFGREEEAFASFNQAIKVVRTDSNPYRAAALWSDYGFVALTFGRTRFAKACHEHALLIARQSGVGWYIPTCCMWYAEILVLMGQHAAAREHLEEALASDTTTPLLDENIAAIGIPLALRLRDEVLLKKCMRPHVINRVFLSGEPFRIGHVVTAFASLYVEQGQSKKAQTLLHRAVEATHAVAERLHLPLEVARFGAKADFRKARVLLEARVALPNAQVAQAYLHLLDAFVAQREGRHSDCYVQARHAAARFDDFGWQQYTELARSLLPFDERQQPAMKVQDMEPFSDTHAKFTKREREVATLILNGFTNRAMADTLAITENTVEKHVAAVMSKLGIRSRYQLTDHLTDSVMRRG